ncbi:DUF2953 domain-containing protein [Butyrivibrio sp. Su6]|uniref:DUF2953 domain-containing protein n=1 Tax=Butyrivibrio sp. Su6 TaxID=1520810 RepID=UPI00135A9F27|nr:DUF2953 domain-containing protein [Butyrivibrio sp. Su6]
MKILGIILLCVIGFILILLLLILFVPVRYRIDSLIPRTDLEKEFDVEKIYAKVSFSWLLHILSGGIVYPENKQFEVRLFGIRIFPLRKKKEKADNKDNKDESKPSGGVVEMSNIPENDHVEEAKEEADSVETDTVETDTAEASEKEETNPSDEAAAGKESDEEASDEPRSFLDVLWNIIDKVTSILETPQNVFEKIQYTISRVCGKISMIKTTIENDIFKRAFGLVKRKLLRIIKMILPDKCNIRLGLGTGDPAQTAELVGIFGAMYPFLFNKVSFEPDFDEKVIEMDAHLKGHITVFTIVYSAAVCFFNKDVKKVIRRFKKILRS